MNFKEIRVAVKTAKQKPSKANIHTAMKLIAEMEAFIRGLDEVEDHSGRALARKARPRRTSNSWIEERQARQHICLTYLKTEAEPSYKAPRSPISLEIREGETPEQAYRRAKEERLTNAKPLEV